MSLDEREWRQATDDETQSRVGPESTPHLQLLTVERLCTRPRPKWLVRNLLPERGLGVIYGEPGSGKTFLVLDLVAAIARGERWMGVRARAGGVVYVACEGALRNRLEAYLTHHELIPSVLSRLRVIESGINLLDAGADLEPLIGRILEAGEQVDEVSVVVIDTLNRAMSGGNENAPDDMGRMIAAAGRISAATRAAVVFVHHCGKDASRGSRGHSSLKGAADLEILVTYGDDGMRCAEVTKVKDGEPGQRYGFRLVSVDLGMADDPEAEPDERVTSCAVAPTDASPRAAKLPRCDVALQALQEAVREYGERMPGTSSIPAGVMAVHLDRWLSRWRLRTGDDYSTEESAKSAFRRERGSLLRSGKVQCSGKFVWIA